VLLSSGHGIPIIQKAKKLKKIEHFFAQLVADLMYRIYFYMFLIINLDLNQQISMKIFLRVSKTALHIH